MSDDSKRPDLTPPPSGPALSQRPLLSRRTAVAASAAALLIGCPSKDKSMPPKIPPEAPQMPPQVEEAPQPPPQPVPADALPPQPQEAAPQIDQPDEEPAPER